MSACCTEWSVQAEVNDRIVEVMAAIDEDDFKGGIGSSEIGGGPVGSICDKLEGRVQTLRGSGSLGMGQANAKPL
jgi:hypothetical protein